MRSIKKANSKKMMGLANSKIINHESKEIKDGPYFDQSIPTSSPGMKASATTLAQSISFKSADPKPKKSNSASTKKFKSKMGQEQMEAVINEIKKRFGEQKIQAMSSQELQTEVMNEIIKEKQKKPDWKGL